MKISDQLHDTADLSAWEENIFCTLCTGDWVSATTDLGERE
jgi:hypothetical protein